MTMSGAISKANKSSGTALTNQGQKTMQTYINSMKDQIAAALPSVITPERFTRIVLTALSSNPRLASCEPKSFLGAMMTAAQLGVEPNTPLGQAYLIPYGNQCQFQLGYKGLIDLAYRSGEISTIGAEVVYENDEFEYELGLDSKLNHKPLMKGDRGSAIAYYAYWKGKDAGYGFCVMSVDDIRAHAKKFSKAGSNSPWATNFDEMAKKTVLKKVLKYAPLKTDFSRQISTDESVHDTLGADMTAEPVVWAEGTVSDAEFDNPGERGDAWEPAGADPNKVTID